MFREFLKGEAHLWYHCLQWRTYLLERGGWQYIYHSPQAKVVVAWPNDAPPPLGTALIVSPALVSTGVAAGGEGEEVCLCPLPPEATLRQQSQLEYIFLSHIILKN